MWYINTVEYYLVFTKEILIYVTLSLNLEVMTLKKKKKASRNPNAVWSHLYEGLEGVKFIDTGSRMVISKDKGDREVMF